MKHVLLFSALGLAFAAAPASADVGIHDDRVASGKFGNLAWQARSMVVGQTSTGDFNGGGDPIYFPTAARQAGQAALIMEYDFGRFICSGSVASDRRSIVTAAHCVTIATDLGTPNVTTAYLWNGGPSDRVPFNPAATAITVSDYFINPGYTGAVIDENDIAVLRLSSDVPDWATAYELYTGDGLTGEFFTVNGYGGRSDVGGSVGANQRTGFLREGDNIFDFRLGDAAFGGQWSDIFADQGPLQYSYVSDFDNGRAGNDTACIVSAALGLPGGSFCDTGVGAREVGIAGGDSGGGGYVDGQLASVNSYGLTFGSGFGDWDDALNSSWGEFSGYVPIYIHADWINGVLVSGAIPEPATWATMILGFGVVGFAARRRRTGPAMARA
jgi:hypothetical protein